jgi:hypothetical protein
MTCHACAPRCPSKKVEPDESVYGVAGVIRQDVAVENGVVSSCCVRLAISFRYDGGD